MQQPRETLRSAWFCEILTFTFYTPAPEEKPKEKQYDDETQLLVDTADAARKEFDEIDRKNR